MLRAIGMALVWAAPLVLIGCDDGGYYDNGYGGGYYDPCQQFVSCGACTPIYGCGWCTYGNRQGICLSDPSECRTSQFTWTWEPKGCSAVEDAGTPTDASEETSGDAADGATESGDAPAD
jgi:hypothetical protein